MESQEIILAKLVLGYLKTEKCKVAYREFLKTSSGLQHLDISHSKYICTRFLGLTLDDILAEYSDISQIVQGRLEATNYYNEDRPKESLADQLLYLLNKVPSSRPSTPGYSTPQGSCRDDRSPSHSDLDATRADTLPGNTPSETSYSPKRKSFNRYGKKALATSSPNEIQNRSELFNTEALAENLLENKEFHEKIAQTINKVVERQFDSTVKEVIQETEQDPIFDRILDEIIGTSNNIMDLSRVSESNNAITSTTNILQENKNERNDFEGKSSLNSQKPELEKSDNSKLNVDLPNASIKSTQQKPVSNQPVINVQRSEDLFTSQYGIPAGAYVHNPVYINTITGLLIPPITTVVLNKPQPSPKTSGMLSEQDIMKMPIILKDDAASPTKPAVENEEKGTKTTQTILPAPRIQCAGDEPQELKDFFTNYRPDESNEPFSTVKPTGLKRVMYPKSSKKGPNSVKKPASSTGSKIKNHLLTGNPNDGDDEKDEVIEILSSETKDTTPLSSDPVKKTTPKSGSHIRNLNFSTPLKLSLPRQKLETTKDSKPEGEQKKAVKTLFKQDEVKTWDSDLRVTVQKPPQTTPKKQGPSKKSRKRPKKSNLNCTEQEGILLEAAIQTPIKHDPVQQASTSQKQDEEPENIRDDKKSGSQTKTVLSPSKLNASKNNILEPRSEEKKAKFITPDMVKEHQVLPIKANRNITPMLDTPFKYQQLPKTPGVATPIAFNDDGTPFTRMLDANLNGMDIDSIETPSLLNTPGFPPNTPCIDLISPYANRPTDYSTGSSYYQPSDNEQNKILEAQVREVEKASGSGKVVIVEAITISDHLQNFNRNIIGKKNLNLIKKDLPDSGHSENSYSSSEEEKDDSWCGKESNDTIIFKKKIETPKRYSLRTRGKKIDSPQKPASSVKKSIKRTGKIGQKVIKKSATKNKKTPDTSLTENKDSTENIKSIISQAIEKSEILPSKGPLDTVPSGVTASQLSVLKELEKKRLRTINSFKTKTEPPPPKPKKQVNGKFKIKPIAKVFTTKTGKKLESPRKRKRAKEIMKTVMSDLITSDDSEVHLSFSEEEEEEEHEKIKIDLKVDKVDKTASDIEAQNLIEGLKERGIHLMHNKSPKKKSVDNNKEIINTSDLQMETVDREIFDKKSMEGENIIIVYDENKKSTKTLVSPQELETTEYIGKLYLESIDKEIDIHLKQTDFITLIDIIPDKKQRETKKDHVKVIEHQLDKKRKRESGSEDALNLKEIASPKAGEIGLMSKAELTNPASTFHLNSSRDREDEDLMNFASTGREKMEENLSPKSSKKRRISDESESENSRTMMLKTLDVDSFLNKIHQKNFRPKK